MNIFLTGGCGGLGKAVIDAAVKSGHSVAFTYFRSSEKAHLIESEYGLKNVKGYFLDVKNSKQVDEVREQVIKDFGTIGAVINNAGLALSNIVPLVSDFEWDEVVKTNLYGPFYIMRSFLEYFLLVKQGTFVTIGSMYQDGSAGNVSYAASKAGLVGLSNSIAKEYVKRGIRSNLICPSFIKTPMVEKLPKTTVAFWEAHAMTKDFMNPLDVAELALYLCSEKSKLINGATIPVHAGADWVP